MNHIFFFFFFDTYFVEYVLLAPSCVPRRYRRYAQEAEFTRVAILPIEHDTFRFYRLEP